MPEDWDRSADAWIADMGEGGDFSRRHVLDPVMLARVDIGGFSRALDVGCGEGRFCRMMRDGGVDVVGIDPTAALIGHARSSDPVGTYVIGRAESIPFAAESFDLVVSYLSLVDVPELPLSIDEMARVLRPGGALLIANLTSFFSAGIDRGWIRDEAGAVLYHPVDRYLEERAIPVSYRGIEIENWHRPLETYMSLLIGAGLQLTFFAEPRPQGGDPEKAARYCRAPWLHVMEWRKPGV